MKGYLFFDIDGTLEDSSRGQPVSEGVIDALNQANENGYACLICSGRNLRGLRNYRNLGMKGYVFSDGGGIMIEGKEPVYTSIPDDVIRNLIRDIPGKYNGDLMMATAENMFAGDTEYRNMYESACRFADENTEPDQVMSLFGIRKLSEYNGDPVNEIDVSFPDEETEALFVSEMDDRLEFISTSESYGRGGRTAGELTCRGVTKASGAKRITEMLGGSMKNTYAFGDSMNDASVLIACEYGIAMGNSPQELKDLADYVTGDVSEDGVVSAMKHFGII